MAVASAAACALFPGVGAAGEVHDEDMATVRAKLEQLKERLAAVESQWQQDHSEERPTPAQTVTAGAFPGSWTLPGTDRCKRTLAVCYLGTEDLNGWMEVHGLAVAYRHYSHDYMPQEDEPKTQHRGMWAGEFEMPWNSKRHPLRGRVS